MSIFNSVDRSVETRYKRALWFSKRLVGVTIAVKNKPEKGSDRYSISSAEITTTGSGSNKTYRFTFEPSHNPLIKPLGALETLIFQDYLAILRNDASPEAGVYIERINKFLNLSMSIHVIQLEDVGVSRVEYTIAEKRWYARKFYIDIVTVPKTDLDKIEELVYRIYNTNFITAKTIFKGKVKDMKLKLYRLTSQRISQDEWLSKESDKWIKEYVKEHPYIAEIP